MRMKLARHTSWALAALLLTSLAGTANADLPKKVLQKFKGQILVTTDAPLSTEYDSDTEMIRAYQKANTTTLKSSAGGEGVQVWSFYFMAFMKRAPGARQVSLDFYRLEGKKQTYVANKRLTGIDPKLGLLATRIELSEDDGLSRNANYLVKLVVERKKKELVLATTKLRTR
jgi:hypothetical protein